MRKRARRDKGLSLVEFATAMVIGFPMIVAMLYGVLEANMYFAIRTACDNAVRRAAQLLINDYVNTSVNSPDVTNGNLPTAMQFDIPTGDGHYFVYRTAKQFTWTWDLVDRPNTLTVTVTYPKDGSVGGQLLTFPYPDPLNLKSKINITTTGTFAVPPIN